MTFMVRGDTQDARDGRALRLLREALPKDWILFASDCSKPDVHVRVRSPERAEVSMHGDTIEAAADAARAALEARR